MASSRSAAAYQLAGTKRRADDEENGPISLNPVPAYNPSNEGAPRSVSLSSDWKKYEQGKAYIHKLLTEPMKKSEHQDEFTEAMVRLVEEATVHHQSEEIVVCFTGNMNPGARRASKIRNAKTDPVQARAQQPTPCFNAERSPAR